MRKVEEKLECPDRGKRREIQKRRQADKQTDT